MTRSPVMLAVAVALLATLVSLVDVLSPSTAAETVPPVEVAQARSGAWYCAVGDTDAGATLDIITAAAPLGEAPADVATDRYSEGLQVREDLAQLVPEAARLLAVSPDRPDLGLSVRWWNTPAAVTRIWRLPTTAGPRGTVAGPCAAEPSPLWVVPGMATAGGAQATVVLANPFDVDASVAIDLTTPEGLEQPELLENLVVPKRSVREVLVNAHAPERTDVGVIVRTRAGRVVVEGYQTVSAAVGGVEGVSLLAAAPRPATTWTIPWAAVTPDQDETAEDPAPIDPEIPPVPDGSGDAGDDDPADAEGDAEVEDEGPSLRELTTNDAIEQDGASWVWVSNPEDRPAAVILTVHTVNGGTVPDLLEELTLDPGQVRRVDLRGLLPQGIDRAGITVQSTNDVPVVASVGTQIVGDDELRTGLSVQLGAASAATGWVLSGPAPADRASHLAIVNSEAAAAVVDIALWDGTALTRPEVLQGVQIGPGGFRMIDVRPLLADGAPSHTVFITSRGGRIVAGRVGFSRIDRLDLVAGIGVPTTLWEGGDLQAPAAFEPGMAQRIGTRLGPSPAPPAGLEPTEPAPTTEPDDPGTEPEIEPAPTPAGTGPVGTEPAP